MYIYVFCNLYVLCKCMCFVNAHAESKFIPMQNTYYALCKVYIIQNAYEFAYQCVHVHICICIPMQIQDVS